MKTYLHQSLWLSILVVVGVWSASPLVNCCTSEETQPPITEEQKSRYKEILMNLEAPEWAREAAAERLRNADPAAAVEILRDMRKDPSPAIRKHAIHAIAGAAFRAKQKVLPNEIIEALNDPDDEVCEAAATYIGLTIEPKTPFESCQVMVKALSHRCISVRQSAANALATMGEKAKGAVPELLKATNSKDWSLRHNAALALWRITESPEKCLTVLLHNLDRICKRYRAPDQTKEDKEQAGFEFIATISAIKSMITESPQKAGAALVLMLGDQRPEIRLATVCTLGAVAALDEKLRNGTLRKLKADKAIQKLLDDPNPEVRAMAVKADKTFRDDQHKTEDSDEK